MQYRPEGITSGSIIANIPNFTPSELYDVPDDPDSLQGYETLEHTSSRRHPVPPSILGVGITSTATKYEQLNRHKQIRKSRGSPPETLSKPIREYDVPDRPDSMSQKSRSKSPRIDAPAKPGYEDIDFSSTNEAGKKCDKPLSKSPIAYRRMTSPQDVTGSVPCHAHKSPVPSQKPHRAQPEDYSNLDRTKPLPPNDTYDAISEKTPMHVSAHKPLLPPPKPHRPQSAYSNLDHAMPLPGNDLYSVVSEETQVHISAHKAPLSPQMSHTPPEFEDYGKLDHNHTQPFPCDAQSEESQMQVVHPEMYHKLNHRHSELPSPSAEEYGELDHSRDAWEASKAGVVSKPRGKYSTTSGTSACKKKNFEGPQTTEPDNLVKVEGYEMLQGKSKTRHTVQCHQPNRKLPHLPEQYGRLEHNTRGSTKPGKMSDRDKPNPNPKLSSGQSHQDGTQSNFDPYGTLTSTSNRVSSSSIDSESSNGKPGDMIEEEYSTPIYSVMDKPKPGQKALSASKTGNGVAAIPPPGYEKFTPLCPSTAQLAARVSVSATELNPPSAPPRNASIKKKRYENIDPSGEVGAKTEDGTNNQEVSKVAMTPPSLSSEAANSRGLDSSVTENKPPKPKVKPKPRIV